MPLASFRHRANARTLAPKRRRDRRFSLRLEPLETRALLSASSLADELVAQPFSISTLGGITNTAPRGYTPSQIGRAYGFDQISFNGGAVKGDGSGQTIAIVAAYDHPNVYSDLQVFDRAFGLPDPPSFRKINQHGGAATPAINAAWAQEIALDVQWAHALAPAANILLVEANTASLSDLLAAVDTARKSPGVSVISMSWGTGEFPGQGVYDSYFTTPPGHTPVTFVAAAGDSGAQAVWPAISSNVISVGGTTLSTSQNGYSSETAWSGSGGGYSQYVSQPSYQRGVQSSGARSSPDVSTVANPNTGVAIYDSLGLSGRSGWFQIGGTSAAAPQWAALVAIVDQGRALSGQPLLGDGHAALYGLAGSDFHDVTAGSNGNRATTGYDLVTGRGTPVANAIVHDLVAASSTTKTGPVPTPAKPTPAQAPIGSQYRYQLVYSNKRWYIVRIVAAAVTDSVSDVPHNRAASLSAASTTHPGQATSEPAPLSVQYNALQTGSPVNPSLVAVSPSGPSVGPRDHASPGGEHHWSSVGRVTKRDANEAPLGTLERLDQSVTLEVIKTAGRTELKCSAIDPFDRPPLDSAAVGACLEPFDFPDIEEPMAAMADHLANSWEADLATLSIAVAAIAYCRRGDARRTGRWLPSERFDLKPD